MPDSSPTLQQRLQCLEDEREIQQLILRYCFSVDSGDANTASACFTEDCLYEVTAVDSGLAADNSASLVMRGRQAILDMVNGERHQALLPYSAHTVGPTMITVDGNQASGTGYSRVYQQRNNENRLFRIAINRWRFLRIDHCWFIAERVSAALGDAAAQSALQTALHAGITTGDTL